MGLEQQKEKKISLMTLSDPSQHACDVYPQYLLAPSTISIPIMYLCITIVFMQGMDSCGLNMFFRGSTCVQIFLPWFLFKRFQRIWATTFATLLLSNLSSERR